MNRLTGTELTKLFEQGYLSLEANKEKINGLNVFPVPDGDTGTNMSLTLQNAVTNMKKEADQKVFMKAKALSRGALMGARGNSGVILSQILSGFSKGVSELEELSVEDFMNGLHQAVETSYKAVMKPVEGTILTVIRETSEGLKALKEVPEDFEGLLDKIYEFSKASLENTPELLPILKQSGVVDAGGAGLVEVFKGMRNYVHGEELETVENTSIPFDSKEYHQTLTEIIYQYCTEFIIGNVRVPANELKERIQSLGDSMVFVQDDDVVKVHIHTNHPGDALESALKVGDLVTVKIENMKLQHETILEHQKELGIVAVSAGEGFSEIFKELGVDVVVTGGQTMNPSTEDIASAVKSIFAKNIIILPNNSNIVLAAKQVSDIIEDKKVYVLESKTVPQGISAMMGFDPTRDAETNLENMGEELKKVSTLQITTSVRNTKINGFVIMEGDSIGILDGQIVAVDKTADKVLKTVIQDNKEKYELITIYYGEEMEEKSVNKVVNQLTKALPDLDIEVYSGGQPVYNYIVSLE
ncbi:DAK2 domain-containing protein [Guggenheimella bovis]